MAKLRRRYTIIDHEDRNCMEVGQAYVLQPAKNPADLAALYTLAENVEPQLAADIKALIAKIEAVPHRDLGSYGQQCLAHVTHPQVKPFADYRMKLQGGLYRMLTGALDTNALAQARYVLSTLEPLTPPQAIHRIYLHWSVEAYGCIDGAYNWVVALLNGVWTAKYAHTILDNARQIQEGDRYAAHTFQRNSFACGIAVDGMVGASPEDFGADPIQFHELEVLCATAAAVAKHVGIDALSVQPNGEPTIATHAECADWDGYFGERWDLARLLPNKKPLTPAEAHATGNLLRSRIHEYKAVL